eukprot:5328-Eustigmatos_ZCMA.PRE.1
MELRLAWFREYSLGAKLDILARLPLWYTGLDYKHGTGHGVGAFLNVHEGPQSISYKKYPYEEGLCPGTSTHAEADAESCHNIRTSLFLGPP